ncbi:MAG: hypothetical protein JSS96_08495 [Bacteroidetes bacterium]|nr:hypothetical protein [Bacteroidota bacterium]
MKHLLLFGLALLVLSARLHAQKQVDYFYNKGLKAYRDSNFTSARHYFRYVITNYPHSQQYNNSIIALGCVYNNMGYHNHAEKLLLPFFQQHINGKNVAKGKQAVVDKSYMHNAALILSYAFEKEKKYYSAFHYLALAYKTYPPFVLCNFDAEHYKTEYAIARSQIYDEMGNHGKAQQELLRISFHFAGDDKAAYMDDLKKLLLKYNDKQQLKIQLSESLHHFTVDTTYDPTWHREYTLYITFLNTKIDVRYPSPADPDRVKILLYLKKSFLYQFIQSL